MTKRLKRYFLEGDVKKPILSFVEDDIPVMWLEELNHCFFSWR